jgi:hypothetical protein
MFLRSRTRVSFGQSLIKLSLGSVVCECALPGELIHLSD